MTRSAPAAKTQQPKPAKYKDSCDNCAQSKVKCNRAKPECQRCIRNGIECHYSLARRGKARLLYPGKSGGGTKQSSSSSLLTPPGPSTPDQQDHHLSSTHLYETDTLGLAGEHCELAGDSATLATTHPPVITSASCCEDVGIHMSTTPGSMSSACGNAGRLAWCNPELTLYPGQQGFIPNDTSINQTGEPISPDHHAPVTTLPLHWTNFQFPTDMQSAGSNATTLQFIDPMLTPSSMTATLFSGVSTAKQHPPEIRYQATTRMPPETRQQVCQGYQSCNSLALSTFESLQVPKTSSCGPTRDAAEDFMAGQVHLTAARTRSTDVVLRASRAAMENVAMILKCPCGGTNPDNSASSLSVLLLLVCSSVVDAIQRIPIIQENMSSGHEGDDLDLDQQHQPQDVDVAQLMSVETPQSCTSEMGGMMDVDVPIAIGGYVLDGHARRKAISSVLLSQLYEVGEIIEKVSGGDSQAQVMGCSMQQVNRRRGSTGEMVTVLESLLMARLRATIIAVKAEAEF